MAHPVLSTLHSNFLDIIQSLRLKLNDQGPLLSQPIDPPSEGSIEISGENQNTEIEKEKRRKGKIGRRYWVMTGFFRKG